MRQLHRAALALTVTAVAACGSAQSTARQSSSTVRKSEASITAEEIATTPANNVYDAVQRLRPQWLTSTRIRGGAPGEELVVYLDGNRYGNLASLRQISVGGVQEVRYYNASEATNRFGTGHTGGAILVMMSKQ